MSQLSRLNKDLIQNLPGGSIDNPKNTRIPQSITPTWSKYFTSQEGLCNGIDAACTPICRNDYKVNGGGRVLYTCAGRRGTSCSLATGKYCACALATPANTTNWCPPMKTINGGITNGTVIKIDANEQAIDTDCNDQDGANRLDPGQIAKTVREAPVSATCEYSDDVLATSAEIQESKHGITGSTEADSIVLRNYCWRKGTDRPDIPEKLQTEKAPNIIFDQSSCSALLQQKNVSDATVNEYNKQIKNWCTYKDVFGFQAKTQLEGAIDENVDTIVLPSRFINRNQLRVGDKLLIGGGHTFKDDEDFEVVTIQDIIDDEILPPADPIQMQDQTADLNPPAFWGSTNKDTPRIVCPEGMRTTTIPSSAQAFCSSEGGDLFTFVVTNFGDGPNNGAYCDWSTGFFGQNDHRRFFGACGPDPNQVCMNRNGVKVCENVLSRTQQVKVFRGQSLVPKPQWLTDIIGDVDLTGGSTKHSDAENVFYISGRGSCECYDLLHDESDSGKLKREALTELAQTLGGPLQCTAKVCDLSGALSNRPLVEGEKTKTINSDGQFLPCPAPTGCIAINNIIGSTIGRDVDIDNDIKCNLNEPDVCNGFTTETSCSNSNPFEKDGKEFACEYVRSNTDTDTATAGSCIQKPKCKLDKFKCENGLTCDEETGKCLDKCTLSDLDCKNGGTISGVKPDCSCTCVGGFTGTTCETPPPTPPTPPPTKCSQDPIIKCPVPKTSKSPDTVGRDEDACCSDLPAHPFDQIITLPSSVDEVYTKDSVVTQGDARGTVLKDTHGPDVTVTVTADFFRKGEVVVGDKTLEITSVRVPGNSQGDEMTLFDKMKNFVRNHLPLSIGVVVFLIIFMIIVIVYFKNKKRS